MPDFEIQLQSIIEKGIAEALNTYRTQFTLVCQILTALVTANIAIVGFAVTLKNPNILYLGAIFPILILFIKIKSEQLMFPVIYCAYHLEQKLQQENIDWLATTYTLTSMERKDNILWEINQKGTQAERMKLLQERCRLRYYRPFSKQRILLTLIVIFSCAVQIALPIIIN